VENRVTATLSDMIPQSGLFFLLVLLKGVQVFLLLSLKYQYQWEPEGPTWMQRL